MSDHIDSIRAQLWEKMRGSKKYRHAFVAGHLSTNIAAQVQTMRESQPESWTQKDLAEKTGMARARISLIENPAYDKLTLSTLKRIAFAFDVALIVRFAPFSELVKWVSDLSPEKMNAVSFDRDSISVPLGTTLSALVAQGIGPLPSYERLPAVATLTSTTMFSSSQQLIPAVSVAHPA